VAKQSESSRASMKDKPKDKNPVNKTANFLFNSFKPRKGTEINRPQMDLIQEEAKEEQSSRELEQYFGALPDD